MEVLAWSFSTGWASGISGYSVVLILGIAGRVFGVEGVPQQSTQVQLAQFDGPLATISDDAFSTMVDVGMISGTFKDRIAYQDVVDSTYLERAHASLAAR